MAEIFVPDGSWTFDGEPGRPPRTGVLTGAESAAAERAVNRRLGES
ncbi:hypothetical protein Misp01_03280 [Microtetraspora sp. NBRC 13810]|nr:hypothetical protein [Microtetraspora sp. NBRC 13810]GLW05198.1 hypothetical protein Misp01_03280 [Microtetraspora sp. NBRC 13810]